MDKLDEDFSELQRDWNAFLIRQEEEIKNAFNVARN